MCMTSYCEVWSHFFYNILSHPVLSGDTVTLPNPTDLLHLCSIYVITLLLTEAKCSFTFGGCIYITLNLNSILGAQWKEILNLLKSTAYLFRGKIPTYECSSCCIFTFTASWKISLNGFICSCVFLWFPCLFADTCGNVDVGLFCCVVALKPLAWYPGDTSGPQVEQQWDKRSGFPLISIFMCLFLWLFVLKLSF